VPARGRRRPSIPGWVAAPAIYALAAGLLIARQGLADPSHVCVCVGPNGDPPFFMWALKWWPYAIAHGLNPFFTNVVWYPGGANIATTTGIPGIALVLWPVTSLFGPIVAYNVAAALSPVLAAVSAYALCRFLTERFWPALVGGFVFGFSSYELGQLTSHLQVALVFLVPLVPLVVLRRFGDVTSRRRFVLLLAGLLAAQVLISTEITFDVGLLGGIALAVAVCLTPRPGRRRLLRICGEIVIAGVLALAVVSPYLYWALIKGNVANYGAVVGTVFAEKYRLAPLNLIVPTQLTWLGGGALAKINQFEGGNGAEAGGYLGIPLLALFVCAAAITWRRRSTRLLAVMFVVTGVLALGPRLSDGSRTVVKLPWYVVESAPVFKAVLPTRFALFLGLIVAVAVALELSRSRRRPWLAWVLAVAGVVAVLPNPTTGYWHSRPPGVPLVVADARQYLPATGSVLFVPVGQFGSSMYWQGDAGFDFHLANGRVALVLPQEYDTEQASLFMANNAGPPRHALLAEFLAAHKVTAVVVAPAFRATWNPALARLGLHATEVGDEAVYYVCGTPPATGSCGRSQ
jgi:hypothetical protein